jgi:hypothetical protein
MKLAGLDVDNNDYQKGDSDSVHVCGAGALCPRLTPRPALLTTRYLDL